MTKKYKVTLTVEERTQLKELLNKGTHSAQKRKRAQVLLLAKGRLCPTIMTAQEGSICCAYVPPTPAFRVTFGIKPVFGLD
jgi:hypothetical protein